MSMTCAWRLLAVSLCCAMAVSAPAVADTQTREAALADWNAEGRHAGLAAPDTQCQDFLQALGRKPHTLEYLGCEQDDASYIKPMTARYRVRGASAAQVETYLHDTFGLPLLRYACCGWSSGAPYAWRAGVDSVRYEIGMGVESLHYPREEWARIPTFDVTVGVTRQSP